jgi:hypothetical protein
MAHIKTFRRTKGKGQQTPSLNGLSKVCTDNILTPVTLSGVVIPWNEAMGDGLSSDFKLACASGVEYFIVADDDWKKVLSEYCWEEVKVKGLLNVSNMTLIPQRVFPKGPTGDRENVIDFAAWKSRELIKKVTKNLNEFVFIPAAVRAAMA